MREKELGILDGLTTLSVAKIYPELSRHKGRISLTPHHGEMAHLYDLDLASVDADPKGVAARAAQAFNAIILLKGEQTVLVDPDGQVMIYSGAA